MLPKKNKIVKKAEIEKLAKTGKRLSSVFFNIKINNNKLEQSRWVVVVSTKVHKSAVIRNRLRRQIREIIRNSLMLRLAGKDIMIIAKEKCLGAGYNDLEKILITLLKKDV